MYEEEREAYFLYFSCSAAEATPATSLLAIMRFDGASVSEEEVSPTLLGVLYKPPTQSRSALCTPLAI